MRRCRKQSGFTLVELAASGAAVAIALVGATAALISSVQLNRSTSRARDSARTVGTLIEEIRDADFDTLLTAYDDTTHEVREGDASVALTDITPRSTSRWKIYRVEIEVVYGETVADGSLRFVTYVSDRNESSGLSTVTEEPADVAQLDGEPIDTTVTDPTVTDPTVTDPTVTDPTVTDPTVTDPTVTDPTVTDPTVGDGGL